MPLRRLLLGTLALAPALLGTATATAVPIPLPAPEPMDHLTVTLRDTTHDGSYDLYCHPTGGTAPHPGEACRQLDQLTRWGSDPFAPVPPASNCSMIYGGPERAHVGGTWAGRPVSADFSRLNGCEIARWNKFSRLLGSSR
ncbi:SSI family serine proteinase inhibitor [Streptomyces orinoci]|uniref:SSI family serine proteinase inhibitor n=1 Tax=Streptomyces orinoci TaxID=67339 RepID=A0ABV3JXX1_STRON|nr:SSI family serine proteinase inhibitor [Streptomyces orinoci]